MTDIVSEKVLLAPLYHLELIKDRDVPYDGNAKTTEAAAQVLHDLLDRSPTEQMIVLYLNSDTQIVGAEKVGMGGVEEVATRPTEIFRGAIVKACPEVILCHNHPSGDGRPSVADIKFTLNMVDVGAWLGVRVRDHIVVVANGKHMSIRENMHLLNREFDQAHEEMHGDMLGLDPRTLKTLKEKMLSLIHPLTERDNMSPGKKGDPKANMDTDFKESLSYLLLSR
jgi:proteasome lid subunit RPN8/RPN11